VFLQSEEKLMDLEDQQRMNFEQRLAEIKQRWNHAYISKETVMGSIANAFFCRELGRLLPGKLLLPGEGEGRNAIHAAKKGWQVDAFDISEAGRDVALRRASHSSVYLNFWLDEFSTASLKKCHYDAIAMIDVFPLPQARSKGFQKILDALRPGGTLILECFSVSNLGLTGGLCGRIESDRLYSTETLKAALPGLRIQLLKEERIIRTELTAYPAAVVRLVGQKPAN
jgi:SAM-dependent methyltransferase